VRKALFAAQLLAVLACGVQLEPSAAHVQVRRGQPPPGYERVANLSCQRGGGFGGFGPTPLDNINDCRILLRNSAASENAELVIIEAQHVGEGGVVVMEAGAYRRKR
jgi:hypothetical protein